MRCERVRRQPRQLLTHPVSMELWTGGDCRSHLRQDVLALVLPANRIDGRVQTHRHVVRRCGDAEMHIVNAPSCSVANRTETRLSTASPPPKTLTRRRRRRHSRCCDLVCRHSRCTGISRCTSLRDRPFRLGTGEEATERSRSNRHGAEREEGREDGMTLMTIDIHRDCARGSGHWTGDC